MNFRSIRIILFLFLVISPTLSKAVLNYQESGRRDVFTLVLSWPGGAANQFETLYLTADNRASDASDGRDGPKVSLGNTVINSYSLSSDNQRLAGDARPYKTYYIDYRLGLYVRQAGSFTYSLDKTSMINNCARAVFIYDRMHPEKGYTNLLADGAKYDFEITAADMSNPYIENRFYIRIYAAEVAKKNVDMGKWTDTSSWESGKLPVSNTPVLIPRSTSLVISENDKVEIGELINYGTLVNSGSLQTEEEIAVPLRESDPLPYE